MGPADDASSSVEGPMTEPIDIAVVVLALCIGAFAFVVAAYPDE